jgi:glycosyltransferase involved in cell wall biosynthesis
MATYNGQKYVLEQLNSILDQLHSKDEVIIVDDCSEDDTINKINSLNDFRIKVYQNESNKGHVFSFAKAISLSKNDIIFLSDQDDIWIKGRIDLMGNKLLDTGLSFVSSNFNIMNMQGEIEKFPKGSLKSKDSTKHFNNILGIFFGKRNYYGCTMAFQKKIINLILPIPSYVESHDLWIALASNLIGSVSHIEEVTLIRRIHLNNVSDPNRKLLPKLRSRIIYCASVIILLYRIKRHTFK